MIKIFDILWFDWWEGDDIYRLPTNWFYAWENIEIRKDLSGVQLSALLEDTGWTIDGDITCIVSLDTLWVSGGWVVVCTDTGKVYLNGTLKETISTGTSAHNEIYWIWVYTISGTQYVYYITRTSFWTGKVHRSTTNLATFNISYREYTTASSSWEYVWVIQTPVWVYFWVNNKVFLMDNSEVVLDYLVLPDKEVIKWFTHFQNSYRIYANLTNTWVHYTWDWASETVDYRQEWYNQPILWVVNNGAEDYAILWFNENYADLYLVQGTQKTELRVNLETSEYARVFWPYLSIREGIVYISWGKSGESANYGVYTYWNYYAWARQSLVLSHSKSTNAFLWHCHTEALSYFACNDGKVYKVSHNNPPDDYSASGYVISGMYQGNVWSEMNFTEMRLGYILNGGTIAVAVRTEFWWTWETIKTISTWKSVKITANELITALSASPLWSFYEFQIKFTLTPWTWTPILKRATTWFNITDRIW